VYGPQVAYWCYVLPHRRRFDQDDSVFLKPVIECHWPNNFLSIRAAPSGWLPELESEVRRYRAGGAVDTTPFFVNMDELEEADAPDDWSFGIS